MRGRDYRQQGRLAGVGLTDEADVCDQLELQLEGANLTLLARLPFPRGLMRRRSEESIALAAAATFRDYRFLSVLEDFGDSFPVAISRIIVPGGTGRTTSPPDRPLLLAPIPCSPRSAAHRSR